MGIKNWQPDLDGTVGHIKELSGTPTTPDPEHWKIFTKADGLWIIDDQGNEIRIGGLKNVVTVTTDFTVTIEDVVFVNAQAGPVKITLPQAGTTGKDVTVKKIDQSINEVLVVSAGGSKLENDTEVGTRVPGVSFVFGCDTLNWWIQSMFIPPDQVTNLDLAALLQQLLTQLKVHTVHFEAMTEERVNDVEINAGEDDDY
jgi:hypothetical protein